MRMCVVEYADGRTCEAPTIAVVPLSGCGLAPEADPISYLPNSLPDLPAIGEAPASAFKVDI